VVVEGVVTVFFDQAVGEGVAASFVGREEVEGEGEEVEVVEEGDEPAMGRGLVWFDGKTAMRGKREEGKEGGIRGGGRTTHHSRTAATD
jgi:hypothetical protein